MKTDIKRIAVTFGGGYVPGLNAIIMGVAMAANKLGWEVVGIRDGFDGILFPERYPEGGLLDITPKIMEHLADGSGCILGTAAQSDPFHVRMTDADGMVEERDRSDELLANLQKEKIDAVVCVVGTRALSILWKLSKKGLRTVCIPKSIENDVEATLLSFGFNSTLTYVTEMLSRVKDAARSSRHVGVVEVPGTHSGWLALQAGMAVCADAVLIPEIRYDIRQVVSKLQANAAAGKNYGLVVVAEGARPAVVKNASAQISDPKMKAALSPNATGGESEFVISQSGRVAKEVALEIQRLTSLEALPITVGSLARAGSPSVADRQLGLGYGAAAVRGLNDNVSGALAVFQPPDLRFVPIAEAINKYRTLAQDSEFVKLARSLDISLGDQQ